MSAVRQVAIRAQGLNKTFRVYLKPGDVLRELFSRRTRSIERHALRDVSFEVHRGEVVGVLGRNGAGKSTLLKIIAGTLDRSAGELKVNGRITAILELGTGFHPEYSGRENIRLGGLCLGMSRDEIDRKTESIIDFSELREVIDQPFRTYSTGMQARLTFATAISVDPDILIIDEALSVGDARFQMKCFARMAELRRQGRTILLVSHDTNTITTFCDRAIVLEAGAVFAQGGAKEMSLAYHNLLFGQESASAIKPEPGSPLVELPVALVEAAANESAPPPQIEVAGNLTSQSVAPESLPGVLPGVMRYGDGAIELLEYAIVDDRGRPNATFVSGAACTLRMHARVLRMVKDASFGFAIKDRRGTVLWGVTNAARNEFPGELEPGDALHIQCPMKIWLAAGDYFVTLGFAHLDTGEKCDFVEDAIQFNVLGPGGIFTTSVVNLESDFQVERNGVRLFGDAAQNTSTGGLETPVELKPLLRRMIHACSGAVSDEERYQTAEALSMVVYPTFKFSEYGRIWLKDQAFLAYYERFMDPGNWHSLDRKYTLSQLLKLVTHLPGDIAEAGAYKGASAWLMCKAAEATRKLVHLFDSFEGLPNPKPIDGAYWFRGALAAKPDDIKRNLREFDNFRLYPGWIPQRFAEIADRKFCFVHVDVDLYEPTLESTRFFYERLVPGGIILFDDYGFATCPGAKLATDEYFSAQSGCVVMLPTGQALVQKPSAQWCVHNDNG